MINRDLKKRSFFYGALQTYGKDWMTFEQNEKNFLRTNDFKFQFQLKRTESLNEFLRTPLVFRWYDTDQKNLSQIIPVET